MVSLIPEQYADLLKTTALAHVATVGPEGEPQSTPVWFAWDGQYVLFSMTKATQKYRNLQRDPRIALSIVDPQNAYRYVEIRGRVVGVEEDADRNFVNSLAKKYLNQDIYPWHRPGDEHVVVRVKPERTTYLG